MKRYIRAASIYDDYIKPRIPVSPNDPFVFDDLLRFGETLATKYNAPQTYWAKVARNNYIAVLYTSCMQCIKPHGFDAKFAPATISGNLAPFYYQTLKTDKYCPPAWQREVYEYVLDLFTEHGDTLTANRYELYTKDGKSYVRDLLK